MFHFLGSNSNFVLPKLFLLRLKRLLKRFKIPSEVALFLFTRLGSNFADQQPFRSISKMQFQADFGPNSVRNRNANPSGGLSQKVGRHIELKFRFWSFSANSKVIRIAWTILDEKVSPMGAKRTRTKRKRGAPARRKLDEWREKEEKFWVLEKNSSMETNGAKGEGKVIKAKWSEEEIGRRELENEKQRPNFPKN